MNEPISWDSTLVKKFSSSNYFKLLNQLRNEVKKYPLKNKKQTVLNESKEPNQDNESKSNSTYSQNTIYNKKNNQIVEESSNKSSVSFNNAKNFSIYNQTNINNSFRENEISFSDKSQSNADSSSPTFKERLDQIEMK
tara:strand:- start:36 stop:449 length:414 start_codon:yes stop_codon:yes gene_type:complete